MPHIGEMEPKKYEYSEYPIKTKPIQIVPNNCGNIAKRQKTNLIQ
jgi:hypothetical protein